MKGRQENQAAGDARRLVGADPTELLHWANSCPYAGTITGYSLSLERRVWVAARCGRWGCPSCGPRKVWRLAFRVAAARPNRLLTLTVNPRKWEDPRAAFDGTRRKVPKFFRELRKKYGAIEYLRVLEATKKGWPHYHFVMRSGYMPQEHLSTIWNELTGAPIVDIRAIEKSSVVLGYVVKYLSKQDHVPWTDRRVTWSKGFFEETEEVPKQSLELELVERSKLPFHVYAASYLAGQVIEKLFGTVYGLARQQ